MKGFYCPQSESTELLVPVMKGFYLISEGLLKLLLSAALKCQKWPLASCSPIWSLYHLNQDYSTQHCASKYSVFLNFRGRDTRDNFVRPLQEALHSKGITAFKDDISVNKGERIRRELFHAIEECEIAIVILSKNYADSVWCLEELVKIMKRKKKVTVFPVFYDVCPSDVRNLSGSFGRVFAKHKRIRKNKASKSKVKTWEKALCNAAGLSGFDLRNYKGDESKCIQDIIEEVRKKLEAIRREEHYNNNNNNNVGERKTVAKCKQKPKLRHKKQEMVSESRCWANNYVVFEAKNGMVVTELGRTMVARREDFHLIKSLKVCEGMTTAHHSLGQAAIIWRVCMCSVRTKWGWIGFSLTIHTTVLRVVYKYFVSCTTKVKVVGVYLTGVGTDLPTQILILRVCYSVLCQQTTTTKATPHVACPRIKPGWGWMAAVGRGEFPLLKRFAFTVICHRMPTTAKPIILTVICERMPTTAKLVHPGFPLTTHIANFRVLVYFVQCQQTTRKPIPHLQIAWASPPYYPHQRLQPIQPYLRERNASYSLDVG